MDFFTQTVDSSLWTSRTFEDPEYDGDTASAAISCVPWTAEFPDVPALDKGLECLIIATGSDAIRAIEASVKLNACGSFVSGDTKVSVSVSGNNNKCGVAVVDDTVPDGLAVSLAQTMLSKLKPTRTLILASCAQWSLRGRPNPGIVWMCTPSATAKYTEDKPRLAAPSFLTGGVAAFVAEGELSQRNLSAAILVKEGISACYNDIKALRNTALCLLYSCAFCTRGPARRDMYFRRAA